MGRGIGKKRETSVTTATSHLVGRWPERVTFQLDPELMQRLDAYAERNQTNRPTIVRQALAQYLDRVDATSQTPGSQNGETADVAGGKR
jgi:predicted transcriptional regulator